ncbi:hypothetical protein JRI60_35235 [Archangium violaceum]|uniref:hypothetical protein n=1 Tax=Archangium violaceum TaxID=83451 RepID=UPI00194FECFB|nr:hypothetical protein [Archangium violaceum]QRN94360.1 hypothetical protein JRI60_35235 [Archangium violaceum]
MGRDLRATDFVDTIRAHQNDPAFLKDLYKGLGDKESEALFKYSANQVAAHHTFSNSGEQVAALKALATSTHQLPPAVADKIAKDAAATNSSHFLTPVLKQPEASESIRRTFLDSAAANLDKSKSPIDAQKFADVLASDPKLLTDYAARLGEDKLANILETALSRPPFDVGKSHLAGSRQDGAQKILGQLGDLRGSQYDSLKTKVFREAASLLGDEGAKPDRKGLVEGLTRLFKSDAKGLIQRLNNDKLGPDASDPSRKALGNFLHAGLFDSDSKNEELRSFVSKQLIPQLRQETFNPSTLGAANDPASPNKQSARALGDLVGALHQGFARAVKDADEDREAIKGHADTLFSVVTELAEGPTKGALTAAKNTLVGEIADALSEDTGKLKEVIQKLRSQTEEGFRDFSDTSTQADVAVSAYNDAVTSAIEYFAY